MFQVINILKLDNEREKVNNNFYQIFGLALKTFTVLFCAGFLFFGVAGEVRATTH